MKRITLILFAVLATVSCKKVTPEQQITRIGTYFSNLEAPMAGQVERFDGSKRIDFLTLNLAKELDSEDIWTLENAGENSLIAEFPGKEKELKRYTLISASLDDPAACAAVIDLMKAFKELKIRPRNTVRTLFYSTAADSTGYSSLHAVNEEIYDSHEIYEFGIEISSCDTLPKRTFVIEENPMFASQLIETIQPYFLDSGYKFVKGTFPNPEWPLKLATYRYAIDPGSYKEDLKAIATIAMLLI